MSALIDRIRALVAPPPHVGDPDDRRRWRRAALVGALLAVPVQLWVLTAGTWRLTRWERIGDFYDAQARAIGDGALAMDPWVLGIEAFYRGENAYMYFGPLPSAFRLPVVEMTDRFEGRLTVLSFVAALVLLFVVVRSLGWQLRALVAGDERVGRLEQAMVALMVAGVFAGSGVLYLSSRTWVYHEASIWGLTLTLGSFSAILRWLTTGARRFVVWATVWATLAVSTRASVAGGALMALGLCLVGVVIVLVLERLATDRDPEGPVRWLRAFAWVPQRNASGRTAWLLVGSLAVPLLSYATVNYIKFRTLFSVPFEDQAFTRLDPTRQQMLESAGGSLFNLRFLPSNLVHYWRPDLLGFSSRWPWITFPQRDLIQMGTPQYDLIDLTAGVPIVMPGLVAAGALGVWVAFRRRSEVACLRVLVVAGFAATFSVLTIGYVANRYHGDFMPLLVVTALMGLPAVTRWSLRRERRARLAVGAIAGVLVVFSVAANLSLAYTFQRAYGPGTAPDQLAGYLQNQIDVGDVIGSGPRVTSGDRLPDAGAFDEVFVLGDCDGLYWSDGMLTNAVKRSNWNVVETADGVNGFAADLVIDRPTRGMVQPLFSLGGEAGPTTVFMVLVPGSHRVQIGYWGPDGDVLGPPIPISFGTSLPLDVVADRHVTMLEVRIDGRVGLSAEYTGDARPEYGVDAVGLDFVDAPFGASVSPVTTSMPVCEQLRSDR